MFLVRLLGALLTSWSDGGPECYLDVVSAIFRHVVVVSQMWQHTPTSGSIMNVTNLRILTQTRCLSRLSCSRAIFRVVAARRTYATYRGMDFGERSQLLSESLDTKQRSEAKQDHVGPFQLGLSPSALRKGEKVQKWSELSTGGKGAHCLKHQRKLLMLGLIVSLQSCVQQYGLRI